MKRVQLVVGLTVGILVGMALSDIAGSHPLIYGTYLITLSHDQTPNSSFRCARIGSALQGFNMSSFDYDNKVQRDCRLILVGRSLPDGGFVAYPTQATWWGRILGEWNARTFAATEVTSIVPTHSLLQMALP